MSTRFLIVIIAFIVVGRISCKIYDRCELARDLLHVHEIPKKYIATWVCLARHESEYNTSAINPGSGDHGLFQISELFWCSPPGYACGVSCESLRDDDITNDVICAKRIFREHKRLSGDGFNAWVVYNLYCKDKNYVNTLIEGCHNLDSPGDNNIKFVDTRFNEKSNTLTVEETTTAVTSKHEYTTILTTKIIPKTNTFTIKSVSTSDVFGKKTDVSTAENVPKLNLPKENNNARSLPVITSIEVEDTSSKSIINKDPKKKEFAYRINKTGFSLKQLLKD